MAQRLCLDERTRIDAMLEARLRIAVIADRLCRCRSAVSREIERGGCCGGRAQRRVGTTAVRGRAQCQAHTPQTPKLSRSGMFVCFGQSI
ncbi:MAG: helix-turn-helix domain-containing protein [Acidimicrobiia bacterium]|nr:helix-turn-helix domain-containing protein [Acidimicrobiia bacterium]